MSIKGKIPDHAKEALAIRAYVDQQYEKAKRAVGVLSPDGIIALSEIFQMPEQQSISELRNARESAIKFILLLASIGYAEILLNLYEERKPK